MEPIKHPLCNAILGPPPGVSEEECGTLHIRRDNGGVYSFWQLTPEELNQLAAGACIRLFVQGPTHPPLHIGVQPNHHGTQPGG